MQNTQSLTFKNGIKDGLPIGLGYLSVSFAFGIKASILGLPALITLFMSMTNLTSAGQLAGVNIIAVFGSFIEIILTQLVINSRYLIMSLSLSQKTDQTFTLRHRILTSAFITDEIFAVAFSKPKKICAKYLYGLAFLPYFGWATGTITGAILGDVLPSVITTSLSIALYAMFIAIIVPPMTKSKGVLLCSIIAISISCTLYYVPIFKAISGGFSAIISAVVSSIIVALIFPIKPDESDEENSTDSAKENLL